MSYRIVYGPEPKMAHNKKHGLFRLQFMTAVCIFLFVLLVRTFWPEGCTELSKFLLPGEPSVTQQALETMVNELGSGTSFEDSFTVFCERIIENE